MMKQPFAITEMYVSSYYTHYALTAFLVNFIINSLKLKIKIIYENITNYNFQVITLCFI